MADRDPYEALGIIPDRHAVRIMAACVLAIAGIRLLGYAIGLG